MQVGVSLRLVPVVILLVRVDLLLNEVSGGFQHRRSLGPAVGYLMAQNVLQVRFR